MSLLHFYRTPALSLAKKNELLSVTRQKIFPEIIDIETEHCFNIETTSPLTNEEMNIVRVLLSETFEPENCSEENFLISNPPSPPFTKGGQRKGSFIKGGQGGIIEVGPRMNFTTAWSTNVVSVCHACGLHKITRIERSRRYKLTGISNFEFRRLGRLAEARISKFLDFIHDRMTECAYP